MKAIILAAGKGERLWPLTRNMPKSLLEIGNGITMLENQILCLSESGIKEVFIVVGYRAEQIEAKIKHLIEFNCEIKTIYNPFFDISNNLHSLWFAKEVMFEDFIIINGDDVLIPKVIKGLFFDIFGEYSYCKMTPADFTINIGGMTAGVGVGYEF